VSTLVVSPQKPWRPTLKNSAPELLGLVFTALSTMFIVSVTPLKGKLGFAITLIIMSLITTSTISWIRRDRKAAVSSVSGVLVFVAAAFVLMPLMSILYEIIRLGIGGLSWGIFTSDMSKTSADAPIGFLTALYIVEVKGRFAGTVRFFVQAMSGVPSIVAGLFIYAVWMIGLGNSYNSIAGAGALTILMIPTVARVSEEVLKLIPNDLREAGLALGATQWRTVAMIVLPAAKSGLVTAIVLGVARVAGETAPLLLTIGGSDQINFNPAAGNNSALPFYVWKNYSFGSEQAVARAWLGILILMILVFFLFSIARYFGRLKDRSR